MNAMYSHFMGKNGPKSIDHALETWRKSAAADGLVVPGNPHDFRTLQGSSEAYDGQMVLKWC
jgi:hypothetical protein